VQQQQNKSGVVILAAGASRRMGRPKLLLSWGGTTVLGHLLQQWNRLGASQIAIVCAAKAKPLSDELDRLKFPAANRIVNPAPENGMFSSIRCAARWNDWNPELTHWVITLGDQPHLRESTLQTLLDCSARNPDKICQPLRAARRKHPVVLPRGFFNELKNTSAADLKIFLAEHAPDLIGFESDDSGLDFDMDTPEDYERLIARENICLSRRGDESPI
jgi:molybdenum cofactor cytidylyltransferase